MGIPEGRGKIVWMVPIRVKLYLVIPIKISGIAVPIKYFLKLGLTKSYFFSNSLTERARRV